LAINIPGPTAAWRLGELGASVTKIVPPGGDPVESVAPAWYRQLTNGHAIVELDLKQQHARDQLRTILEDADILLTSSRPSALARLGLAWVDLEPRYPRLLHVAIVGYGAPRQELVGHDLTYLAHAGLASPPQMPRTTLVDLGGAERAVSAAAALVAGRERGQSDRHVEVALAEAASYFALPLTHGITTSDGVLGGRQAVYRFYEASDGWVAVAALEPHFRRRLVQELGVGSEDGHEIAARIREGGAAEWESWARERDLPLVAVVI
jgi:crotonobetainyl-CoA:carnitine CoA-transferase CaiB-like acyl-CoA transferase